MTLQHASIWNAGQHIARGMFVAALLAACGQDTTSTDTSTASGDPASEYAALSASLQTCEDDQATCTTAAAGDATKIAACDKTAAACKEQTKPAEAKCSRDLRGAAESCMKGRHCDDDAGPNNTCHAAMHGCVGQHVPSLPPCVDALFMCLDKTGIKMSSGQWDDATKQAVGACIEDAHTCFMDQLQQHRHGGDHGAAGSLGFPGGPRAGEGGHPSFPGFAGHPSLPGQGPGPAAAGSGHHEEAGHSGPPFPGLPGHDEAGADAAHHGYAGSPAPGRGHHDGGAGGAAGH